MNAVLLIAVPLLVGFLSILMKKVAPYLLLVVSFLSVVSLDYVTKGVVVIGNFKAPYGIELIVDDYAIAGLYIVNILFFLVAILSLCDYKKIGSILLISLAGLNGLLLTGDLFNLFVFLEIAGISAYLITTTNRKPLATFHYLVLGTVGSSFYLLGLIILYGMFHTLNLGVLSNLIAQVNPALVSLPLLFMFIGLGVEAKLLPLNAWVKGILESSNPLSGPMIASVYASTMVLVFGRILTQLFVFNETLMTIVSVVLVVSIIAGEAMAYASSRAKHILLYSSIAQAAIAVIVFVHGLTDLGIMLVALNGFSKLILFGSITVIERQIGSDTLTDLKGVFTDNKLIGFAFSVAVLSILGLPLFAGFFVKLHILMRFANTDLLWLVIVILMSSVVEGVYFIKLSMTLWYGESENKRVVFSTSTVYAYLIIALLLVVFGVFFTPFESLFDVISTMKGVYSWLI
ncbi:MAG: proton-conducting transporter membrane subunit [Candidatus Izemoplasma sp.]|nr:proton-conducting transporter membrane subunit [Candidatus Izemoplasma sp.]